MNGQPFRFCVFGRAPKALVIFLGTLSFIVISLYFLAPEVPKWSMIPVLLALAFLLFRSDRASREYFEIAADGRQLAVIPAWYEQKFWGKRTSIHEMPAGSALLICLHINYGAYAGITVILRAPEGAETTVYRLEHGLPRKLWKELQDELAARWNIPVKFVLRILSAQGMEEKEWSEEKHRFDWRLLVGGILMLGFPVSGALVRIATPNPLTIMLVGLVLLSAFVLYWRYLFRSLEPDKAPAHLKQNLAVATFQYAIYYAIAALITDSILRK
jgi:hypothetical protein